MLLDCHRTHWRLREWQVTSGPLRCPGFVFCDWYPWDEFPLIGETSGFLVLGPDYFFGAPVQNLPPDRDKVAWAQEARVAAIKVFPQWFEKVKATYGNALPTL